MSFRTKHGALEGKPNRDVESHKHSQAEHFDHLGDDEFEITRPHGTPRLYQFLIAEKFRRAAGPIMDHLAGSVVLTVCGGSGMDAEFFAREGAVVTSSDLSPEATSRARTRAARQALQYEAIVADVEHLPFPDRSVDLVAVHDGLHHLEDPYAGLAEMARVARRWVIVAEPARAAVTNFAIRLRLAQEIEDSGNRVARLEPAEVAEFLRRRGFKILNTDRYAMYYRHQPGVLFRLMSLPLVFPIARLCWRVVNAAIGRFGNKMVVVAERAR